MKGGELKMTDKNNKWKKVNDESSDETWKPVKEGDEVSGIYIDKREKVGPNEGIVYTLKKEDGTFISVWGSAILDSNFAKIEVDSDVKIVYTGKVMNKQGNREFNTYDIFVSSTTPLKAKETKEEEVAAEDIPF